MEVITHRWRTENRNQPGRAGVKGHSQAIQSFFPALSKCQKKRQVPNATDASRSRSLHGLNIIGGSVPQTEVNKEGRSQNRNSSPSRETADIVGV